MEIINEHHSEIAVLIARLFLGFLFVFQGYDAIFRIKLPNVIEAYEATFTSVRIPKILIVLATWFTAYTELIGGILLILGLFEYIALILLSLNLIVAAIGFGLNTPIWDSKHVFPRLVLIIFLLVTPQSWNCFSLDHIIFNH